MSARRWRIVAAGGLTQDSAFVFDRGSLAVATLATEQEQLEMPKGSAE